MGEIGRERTGGFGSNDSYSGHSSQTQARLLGRIPWSCLKRLCTFHDLCTSGRAVVPASSKHVSELGGVIAESFEMSCIKIHVCRDVLICRRLVHKIARQTSNRSHPPQASQSSDFKRVF